MERIGILNSDRGYRGTTPRHSILDLAPLELECMSALWPVGEATVRDIHRQLSAARPRAYTTVLTIMDRLTQKGIVSRRKSGRAYLYRANLSVEDARVKAVEKIVAGFFSGSSDALIAHLEARGAATRPVSDSTEAVVDTTGALDRESKPGGLTVL